MMLIRSNKTFLRTKFQRPSDSTSLSTAFAGPSCPGGLLVPMQSFNAPCDAFRRGRVRSRRLEPLYRERPSPASRFDRARYQPRSATAVVENPSPAKPLVSKIRYNPPDWLGVYGCLT